MPESSQLIAFLLATTLFAWISGPALLYTTARTISQGKHTGCMATLGIHIGGYIHVAAAALSLAKVFQTIPTRYLAVKLVGAAYLCDLGPKLMRRSEPFTSPVRILAVKTEVAIFWQSVTVEILNTKTVIFFVALLPQLTEPTAKLPMWTQLMVLGVIANLVFSIPDIVCVLLSSRITKLFGQSKTSTRWM